MRYFVRAVKYFIYFSLIFALIILILVLLGLAGQDQGGILRDGWKSVGQIAMLFAAVAAFYPRLGFITKNLIVEEDAGDIRGKVVELMESRGYRLETEDAGGFTFRLRNKLNAVTRMLEDRVTFTRTSTGYDVEGLTKDVVRIVSSLEYNLRKQE